jgi:3'-phosphoadenosine 5'-phosphosulfate sulfotransferase (PAPS reductase)/FAD synthetase
MRVVSWFSCGAASAVATIEALAKYPDLIVAYCDTGSEHLDNARFLADFEKTFNIKILILRSQKYQDTWDVFNKTRYLVGINGARCTSELKKIPRFEFQFADDIQIFGFDSSEKNRADRFKANNPDVICEFPLIDSNISKKECLARLTGHGIEIPMMYKLGYKNNNCIGCVKGQAGYWNKIRKDFPDIFEKMAKIERKLNVAICKTYKGGGAGNGFSWTNYRRIWVDITTKVRSNAA